VIPQAWFVCNYDYCLSNLGLSGEEEGVADDVNRDRIKQISQERSKNETHFRVANTATRF